MSRMFNPVLRGWFNYYGCTTKRKCIRYMDA
ncbi:hypothetical protein JFN88_14630 [Paenibacillus sp. MAHUQ-46]|uniref:Group II intron maturase-specific domain-containing protein n=1 Tax=Paenibacillus roseus TaxID=2798579 RepID=A0A934J864_9BACL|nr:hypothetical protein [Paenibacillus roseus]